jgi:hypothetical protein
MITLYSPVEKLQKSPSGKLGRDSSGGQPAPPGRFNSIEADFIRPLSPSERQHSCLRGCEKDGKPKQSEQFLEDQP